MLENNRLLIVCAGSSQGGCKVLIEVAGAARGDSDG